uniref:C2H2-type domain-containing protein n=1 Tax=Schizaphis graminum TaxID=13262 RepID=A0A2S2PJ59_SCHGA
MFKCPKCKVTCTRKYNLNRHLKLHDRVRHNYQCGECTATFKTQFMLSRHIKKLHDNKSNNVEETPQVNVPHIPAAPYIADFGSDDDTCMTALKEFENTDLYDTSQVKDPCTTAVKEEITSIANSVNNSEIKKNNIPACDQLIAENSENLHKGSTLREIYKEYLEVHNSHTRMMNWVSHAASFSYRFKLEFGVLGILMLDTRADDLTPIDEAIIQMLHQDSFIVMDKIQHHTQHYIFMQLIYSYRRIMDDISNNLINQIKTNWMKNTIKVLEYFGFTYDTVEFMIERIKTVIIRRNC